MLFPAFRRPAPTGGRRILYTHGRGRGLAFAFDRPSLQSAPVTPIRTHPLHVPIVVVVVVVAAAAPQPQPEQQSAAAAAAAHPLLSPFPLAAAAYTSLDRSLACSLAPPAGPGCMLFVGFRLDRSIYQHLEGVGGGVWLRVDCALIGGRTLARPSNVNRRDPEEPTILPESRAECVRASEGPRRPAAPVSRGISCYPATQGRPLSLVTIDSIDRDVPRLGWGWTRQQSPAPRCN